MIVPVTPKRTIPAGIIAGAVVGTLLFIAASIAIFMLVYRRRKRRAVMSAANRISSLMKQDLTHADLGGSSDSATISNSITALPQEKGEYIQNTQTNRAPTPQAETESEVSQATSTLSRSPLLQPPPTFRSPMLGDTDPDVVRVTLEATIGRMAEHIHHLEAQLAEDGYSDAPPPTYVSS
ncbi:hypothetical protein BDP27DRAFT_1346960 [Rhodocollybia butyracea]|uniref:Uncharacterized protein n=1 Tax=Rhodocollybia butyracea TaxID=206335 RepID=A0A9P5P7X7_9AGAR|nr:hypothetical protein BDP27DRAFT_1346960 [Rhodocollybia butyracea]